MNGDDEQAGGVSVDHVLASLDRQYWDSVPSTTSLDIKFLEKIPGDYNYKKMAYSNTIYPGEDHRDMFRVNEHLSVLISFVSNSLVIAVFVRVLGLARLPSRIIVSLACVNLVVSLCQALHTTSATVTSISDSVMDCRFVTLLLLQGWVLQFNAMSAAIIERILACNIPTYYSRALHIIGPVILITPWAYWTFMVVLITIQFFDFDLGYQCSSHLNVLVPDSSQAANSESSVILEGLLLAGLGISLILHSQNSGDVWEVNRMHFEVRTTAVILRVAGLTLAFAAAVIVATPSLHMRGLDYEAYRHIHLAFQISVHKGMSLIIVLLTRQEFRRHLPLVFESSASISRTRTHNLMIAHPPERSYSSRLRRLSDMDRSRGTSGEARNTSGDAEAATVTTTNAPRARHASSMTQSMNTYESNPLVSRDKMASVQTPEWLKKKEPKAAAWPTPVPKFLAGWLGHEPSITSHDFESYEG